MQIQAGITVGSLLPETVVVTGTFVADHVTSVVGRWPLEPVTVPIRVTIVVVIGAGMHPCWPPKAPGAAGAQMGAVVVGLGRGILTVGLSIDPRVVG